LGHTTVSDNLQLEHYKFSVQLEHWVLVWRSAATQRFKKFFN
jgi:hypothetical protein